MLDMGQLTTFLAAAELGNFTHTGRRLHLSQSAVSQQMRDLEHQLGCPLFVRRSRNITLTPAGERLLPLARKLVADARDAAEVVREVGRDQQGVVRVAASPLVAHALLVPALAAFTIAHPGLRVCVDVVPADFSLGMLRVGAIHQRMPHIEWYRRRRPGRKTAVDLDAADDSQPAPAPFSLNGGNAGSGVMVGYGNRAQPGTERRLDKPFRRPTRMVRGSVGMNVKIDHEVFTSTS